MSGMLEELKRQADADRPLYYGARVWRPFPVKHTKIKVVYLNGKYQLAIRVVNCKQKFSPNISKIT